MSHFSVMVVLPAGGSLEAALQPFHEYESTDEADKYVVWVDEDDEIRKEFVGQVENFLQDPSDSELYDRFDKIFYRPATRREIKQIGSGGGTGVSGNLSFYTVYPLGDGAMKIIMVHDEKLVAGFREVTRPIAETTSLVEWAKEWNGCELRNGRFGRMTNPNAKWDWWKLGGRWSGLLLASAGMKGEPGLAGSQVDADGLDICLVGDLDLDAMKARDVKGRRDRVAETLAKVVDSLGVSEAEVLRRWDAYTIEMVRARKAYEASCIKTSYCDFLDRYDNSTIQGERGVSGIHNITSLGSYFALDLPDGTTSDKFDEWCESVPSLQTFAVLMNGEWHEHGEMGWFGVALNEKDDWSAEFAELLGSLEPGQQIAIVDCHI